MDSGYLVCATPPIALKLYMCYGHGMKMCMWFGYNPLIFMPPTSKKLRGHIGCSAVSECIQSVRISLSVMLGLGS